MHLSTVRRYLENDTAFKRQFEMHIAEKQKAVRPKVSIAAAIRDYA